MFGVLYSGFSMIRKVVGERGSAMAYTRSGKIVFKKIAKKEEKRKKEKEAWGKGGGKRGKSGSYMYLYWVGAPFSSGQRKQRGKGK